MAWTNHKHVPTHTRRRILNRDRHTCQRCGATGVPLEVDHINNQRGPNYNTDRNLQALCVPCHRAKTRRETQAGINRRTASARHPGEPHPGLV